MGRRQLKAKHLVGVKAREAFGQITAEQADHFRGLYARCQTPDDFKQVLHALESFSGRTVTTRYTRLLADPLDDDD